MRFFPVVLIAAIAALTPLPAQLPPQVKPEEVGLSQERLNRIRPMMEKYIADNQMAGSIALIARAKAVRGSATRITAR